MMKSLESFYVIYLEMIYKFIFFMFASSSFVLIHIQLSYIIFPSLAFLFIPL